MCVFCFVRYHHPQRLFKDTPVEVFVRPGETAWVKAPPGVYHLRLSEGRRWFGPEYQFGPPVVPAGSGRGGATPAEPGAEPYANHGTSKWSYPAVWLYRSRGGRWVLTLEDPTRCALSG